MTVIRLTSGAPIPLLKPNHIISGVSRRHHIEYLMRKAYEHVDICADKMVK